MLQWIKDRRGTIALIVVILIFAGYIASLQSKLDRVDRQAKQTDTRTQPFHPAHHKFYGFTTAQVRRGESIGIRLAYCNDLPRTVTGRSTVSWQAVKIDGGYLPGQASTIYAGIPSSRPPGCHDGVGNTLTEGQVPSATQYPMPTGVATIDQSLNEEGIPHQWQVVGSFTPLRPDGQFGVPDAFISPPFTVVP